MEKFIEALKERAGFFLCQMGQFRPFRVFIKSGEVIDTVNNSSNFSENEMYELLLKEVHEDLKDPDIKASAIVLFGQSDGYDVIVVEIFRNLRKKYQAVFPYTIKDGNIHFGSDLNKRFQTGKEW